MTANPARQRRRPRQASLWGGAGGVVVIFTALALQMVSCGRDEPAPVTAARSFARVAQGGSVERLLPLMDQRSAEHLRQAAERASDQVGGRRNIEPQEMLQVVDVDPRFQVEQAELLSEDEHVATVRLVGTDGSSHQVDLVNEEGIWRVRLPLPRGLVGAL